MFLRLTIALSIWLVSSCFAHGQAGTGGVQNNRPLRALLICGGCCHDYTEQHKILSEGVQARANIQVDVWWTNDKSVNPPLTVYDDVNWAKDYDVIIHDECAARNTDVEVMKRILEVHKKTPAVHLHCAMHSFRNGTDLWFKHLGLQSTGHGPHAPIDVRFTDRQHPIVAGMDDWTIEKDELYNNANVFDAHALARGRQTINRNGKQSTEEAIVIWTNEKQGARSFSMSIGHYNKGVSDDRYLDLVTRGVLWTCDKLSPEFQNPFLGENVITFVDARKNAETRPGKKPKVMQKNAKLVYVSASSIQDQHIPAKVLDGDPATRWCAENANYPQWIQMEFEKPQRLTAVKLIWERNVAYQYLVRASSNGTDFATVVDGSGSKIDQPRFENFVDFSDPVKVIRIEGIGTDKGGWCSLREIEFKGKKIKALWPADKKFRPMFQPTPAGEQAKN